MPKIMTSRCSGVAWPVTAWCAGLVALTSGCDSLDKPSPEATGSHLVIPTDTRPAYHASRTPVPISGGTLLVTRTGSLAVASDPDRDAIVVADLGTGALIGRIALEKGDEPGRLVEDDAGQVHVALRRGGAVATIDPRALTVLARQSVCGAPRGLAISSSTTLEVACADGKLVTLPLDGGAALRSVSLEPDLRDVVVTTSGVTVSRFKSAELLRIDATGSLTRRDRLPAVTGNHSIVDKSQPKTNDEFGQPLIQVSAPFRPLVAWRTLAGPNGSTIIVHQRALDEEIDIVPPSMNGSSYGGAGFSCSGIAQNAISVVGSEGAVASVTFQGAPLPVDAALSPDGLQLLVAMAGPRDRLSPKPFVDFENDGESVSGGDNVGGFGGTTTLALISLPWGPSGPGAPAGTVQSDPGCAGGSVFGSDAPPAVAVAYDPSVPSRAVVQTVQPSTLMVIDVPTGSTSTITFDDGTTLDTGFELFHRDSGAGVACATCHAEGAEDGNVWRFSTVGARRTQALHVGLQGTAPFHWDGELGSVGALMNEVFVGRMGGIHESDARLARLEGWLYALKAPAPLRAANDETVLRGEGLFRSSGCAVCHSGAKFTNNKNVSVGTSSRVPLQVPSLIGVGYRAPFLHDGCAQTLADRFNPACGGGDDHGSTSRLTTAEIGDLVAYLESL